VSDKSDIDDATLTDWWVTNW